MTAASACQGKAGERNRERLHTAVGCSHGDERHEIQRGPVVTCLCKTAVLQDNIYMHSIYACMLFIIILPLVKCQMYFPSPSPNIHYLLFTPVFLSYQLYFLPLPRYTLNAGWRLRANAVNVSGFKALQMSAFFPDALNPRLAFNKSVSFRFKDRFMLHILQALLLHSAARTLCDSELERSLPQSLNSAFTSESHGTIPHSLTSGRKFI